MCNLYRLEKAHAAKAELSRQLGLQLTYPDGIKNFGPRAEIRITDRAPILRRGQADEVELVQRRWSWPGPGGKPVFNFRGEGRRFAPTERCVILADGFYEFTAHSDPQSKKKHKWLFTLGGEPWFGVAGLCRQDSGVGEAFTMLTCEPSPDVAPYHSRSIVVLPPADCLRWLDPATPEAEIVQPLPAGSLTVEQVN
jgi:putative SOS response-associated peptidase YedK